ncbi:MAG: MBL fold metallo-hydrolase [Candidatus Hydrogenedentes bacterium]|nr:MBL fold metallo-hydrolase [Candidatus Hydrogenedentota bacterium]
MAREPFQVFDNLYFVGIGEVASYVITTSEGSILIDTLWDLDGYTEYLLGNIREVGLDPMDIQYVLILQGHRDHYGGARALQGIIDAQFGTAEEDRKMIEADLGDYAPRIDFIIEDGDTLTLGDTTINFEITPGHTPGTTSMRFSVFDNSDPATGVFDVEDADITKGGDNSEIAHVLVKTAQSASTLMAHRFALWSVSDNRVLAHGVVVVVSAVNDVT